MLVHATPTQAAGIVRAMKCVATGDGAVALSAMDAAAIEACHHVMLHRQEPLDSTHLLSGYSTSPQGELLVSTFTAGMHPLEPMAGHVLPGIFSWHLGIELNPLAGSWTGALHPRKFWVASRGAETIGDPFAADWDFWTLAEAPLEDLKRRYKILPLDPHDAAADDRPKGFAPIA